MSSTRSVRELSSSQEHALLRVILEGYYYEHLNFQELSEKSGVSRSTVFRWIRNFEAANPQMCEQMKKQGIPVGAIHESSRTIDLVFPISINIFSF